MSDVWSQVEGRIKAVVRKVAPMNGFSESDIDDLCQEMWFVVTNATEKHDPSRGPIEPFLASVVANKIRDMARSRRVRGSAQASEHNLESLEQPEPSEDDIQEFIKRELDLETGSLLHSLSVLSTNFNKVLPRVQAACVHARERCGNGKTWAACLLNRTRQSFGDSAGDIAKCLGLSSSNLAKAASNGSRYLTEAFEAQGLVLNEVQRELYVVLHAEVLQLRERYLVQNGTSAQ